MLASVSYLLKPLCYDFKGHFRLLGLYQIPLSVIENHVLVSSNLREHNMPVLVESRHTVPEL